jgi:hypothetical protein
MTVYCALAWTDARSGHPSLIFLATFCYLPRYGGVKAKSSKEKNRISKELLEKGKDKKAPAVRNTLRTAGRFRVKAAMTAKKQVPWNGNLTCRTAISQSLALKSIINNL